MALKKSFFQTANIIFLSILLYYRQYLEENRNKEFKKEKNFIHNNSLYLQNHSHEKNYLRAIKQ